MKCIDCGTTIADNRKRCDDCKQRRKYDRFNAKRREDRRKGGLKIVDGRVVMVDARCMRCKCAIKAAVNRKDSTLCESCRKDANRVKSLGQYHKRNPKPETVTIGSTCCICNRQFVRGLCECRE